MKHLFLLSIIIITFSCSTYDQTLNQNNDYLILNNYLKNKNNVTLVKQNYFTGNISAYFGIYNKWHKISHENKKNFNDLFFSQKQEWIFNIEDIKFMKEKYGAWKKNEWDKNKIAFPVNLIDSEEVKYGMEQNVRVSYPFYNKDNTKAMVIVSKSNTPLNSSVNIMLFKKTNGFWENVGILPFSVS